MVMFDMSETGPHDLLTLQRERERHAGATVYQHIHLNDGKSFLSRQAGAQFRLPGPSPGGGRENDASM